MLVVDTNVLVSLLIQGPFSDAARALHGRDADWHSEPFILVEASNVFATQLRAGRMNLAAALASMEQAAHAMGERLIAVDHTAALTLAARHGTSAYDARYLGVAQALQVPLVTEDAALRRRAPALTCSIAEALAA